eukprot:4283507-Amphidinium_carterae.1
MLGFLWHTPESKAERFLASSRETSHRRHAKPQAEGGSSPLRAELVRNRRNGLEVDRASI